MLTRSKVLAVAAVATLAVSLSACSPTSAPGNTDELHVARSESFDGWDPDKASAYASYQTLQNVLEPLLRLNPDGVTLDPGIAAEWESNEDSSSWTFNLRENASFSDGSPVTSSDVVFSAGVWKEGLNYGVMYEGITSATAIDEYTVRFDLVDTDTSFPVLMSWTSAAIYPEDFGGVSQEEFYASPVGAGPYAVENWSTGGRITLVKNDHYYAEGRPAIERIVIDVVDSDAGRLFDAGQADIVEYVSASEAENYGDSLLTLAPSQVEHLSLNVENPLLSNPDVRQALAHAIDYEAIQSGAFRGKSSLPEGILPPGLEGYMPPSIEMPEYDVDKAKRLLNEAGIDGASFEVIYDASTATDVLVAQILQADFAEIGVELTLTGLETGSFLDRAYGQDADMLIWSFGAVSPSIIDPVSWFAGTNWLFSGQDIEPLLDASFAYSGTNDEAAKAEVLTELQDSAIRDLPAINLGQFSVMHAVSDRISGMDPTPWGMYAWDTLKIEQK